VSLRATLALLAVVVAAFVVALAVGLGRGDGEAAVPGWSAALGGWLAGEQELPRGDLRPASSVSAADVGCHEELARHGTLTLPVSGTCGLFVGASSRSVRTLALRLESGNAAIVRVEWVPRDDRLTKATERSVSGDQATRLQFYEEGGGLRVSCPMGCRLVAATPGPN
jgi:hypothetical protein